MKIHLVIWEVQDSGFKIKGAFLSAKKAATEAERLNRIDRDSMIASTEEAIRTFPESILRVYGSFENARTSTQKTAKEYCSNHAVHSVKVV